MDRSSWLHSRSLTHPSARWAHRFAPPPPSYDPPQQQQEEGEGKGERMGEDALLAEDVSDGYSLQSTWYGQQQQQAAAADEEGEEGEGEGAEEEGEHYFTSEEEGGEEEHKGKGAAAAPSSSSASSSASSSRSSSAQSSPPRPPQPSRQQNGFGQRTRRRWFDRQEEGEEEEGEDDEGEEEGEQFSLHRSSGGGRAQKRARTSSVYADLGADPTLAAAASAASPRSRLAYDPLDVPTFASANSRFSSRSSSNASAASSSSSRKRFSKAHEVSQSRTIAATTPAATSSSVSVVAAAAQPVRSQSSATTAAFSSPASSSSAAPPSFVQRLKRSSSSRSSLSSHSSHSSRSSSNERMPPAAAAASSSSSSTPISLTWTNSQPSLRHFPTSNVVPLSKTGANWIQEYSCTPSPRSYSSQLLSDRIAFMRRQLSVSEEDETFHPPSDPAHTVPPQLPHLTLNPTFITMALSLLLHQHSLAHDSAAALFPVLTKVVRHRFIAPALSNTFQARLREATPLFHVVRQKEITAMCQSLQQQLVGTLWDPNKQSPYASYAAAASSTPHGIPSVVPRPALSFTHPTAAASSSSSLGLFGGHSHRPMKGSLSHPPRTHWKASDYEQHVMAAAAAATSYKQAPTSRSVPPPRGPSGTSADDAISISDSDDDATPSITVQHVLAHQRLSLAASEQFLQASFASDDLISLQKLPLVDPLTLTRIAIPVRSKHCSHVRCMDLQVFLEYASDEMRRNNPVKCPICHQEVKLQDLVVDSFLELRIKEASSHSDDSHLLLHRDGSFEISSATSKTGKNNKSSQPSPSPDPAEQAPPPSKKPPKVVHTVDLLDSDEEEDEEEQQGEKVVLENKEEEEEQEEEEEEDGEDCASSSAPSHPPSGRRFTGGKMPRAPPPASSSDDDDDAEHATDSEGKSRSSSTGLTSSSEQDSAASSPHQHNFRAIDAAMRRSTADGYAAAVVAHSMSQSVSFWNRPAHLQNGPALAQRFASASASTLRPAAPQLRPVDTVDLTLTSDEESEVEAVQPREEEQEQEGGEESHPIAKVEAVSETEEGLVHAAADGDSSAPVGLRAQDLLMLDDPTSTPILTSSAVAAATSGDDAAAEEFPPLNLDALSPDCPSVSGSSVSPESVVQQPPQPMIEEQMPEVQEADASVGEVAVPPPSAAMDADTDSIPVHPPSVASPWPLSDSTPEAAPAAVEPPATDSDTRMQTEATIPPASAEPSATPAALLSPLHTPAAASLASQA